LKNHRRNLKRKRQLTPLPPGTKGDARAYYRDYHNINLYDPNIRKKYYCHHLPNSKRYEEITDIKQAISPQVTVDLDDPHPIAH
jgi:hypothetical protein